MEVTRLHPELGSSALDLGEADASQGSYVNHWGEGDLDGGHPRDYTGVPRAPDTSWEVR